MHSMLHWFHDCWLGNLVRDVTWLFATLETVHFIGMALLIGVVGVIDLRVLGLARGLPLGPLHRLLPWAFLGFGLNVASGIAFFTSDPNAYFFVSAFRFKMLLILLAGLNAIAFWVTTNKDLHLWGPGVEAPRRAKVISATSLLLWTGVIIGGRFIAFFGNG